MIYVDTSVLLSQLLAEDHKPPAALWDEVLICSRLGEYETWVRVHALGLGASHGEAVRQLLALVSFLELSPLVLGRALEPWPLALRTLDALHLASIEHLRAQRVQLRLASYDNRMIAAAGELGIDLAL